MSANPKLALTLQFPDKRLQNQFSRNLLRKTVQAALFVPAEITLRFVEAEEGRMLNRDYRGKDYPTNVLTFSYGEQDGGTIQADIILCTEVLEKEAAAQEKSILDHTIHLVVHGVLHAQGYDHEDPDSALEMESLEIRTLAKLGVENPYKG